MLQSRVHRIVALHRKTFGSKVLTDCMSGKRLCEILGISCLSSIQKRQATFMCCNIDSVLTVAVHSPVAAWYCSSSMGQNVIKYIINLCRFLALLRTDRRLKKVSILKICQFPHNANSTGVITSLSKW